MRLDDCVSCGLEAPAAAVSSQGLAFLPPLDVSTMDRTQSPVQGMRDLQNSEEAEYRPLPGRRENRAGASVSTRGRCCLPLFSIAQGSGRPQGDKAKEAPPPPPTGEQGRNYLGQSRGCWLAAQV